MPSAPRMSKRLSQAAPRLSMSVVMAGEEPQERKHESTVREFFANHTKTIVTLIMIFGTIICIVLIVMVHKWRFENDRAGEIEACPDVAVIGAGISGSYAAWRMRHDTKSHVDLFEMTDTAGGRFRTQRFPEYSDPKLKAELGAMFYIPQRQPLLNRSIHALRLTPEGYYPPNPGPPGYYFRGRHLTRRDFRAHNKYDLDAREEDLTPEELKRYYTELYLDNIHIDPLSVKFKGYTDLHEMGYWNFLNSVASREGFNFVQDGAQWKSHVSNGNAALLASLDLNTWDQHYTLAEGMDALPKAMVREFENSTSRHKVRFNRRLVCIEREQWGEDHSYTLMFQLTETVDGVTYNIDKSERYCARKVILALPPAVLKHVTFLGFSEDFPVLKDVVESLLEPVPAMSAYFMFNQSWWRGPKPDRQEVITDLPMRRMRYIGTGKRMVSREGEMEDGHLFMVANADMADVKYFNPILKKRSLINSECNLTNLALLDLKSQIAKVQGLRSTSSIPDPVRVYVHDWRDHSTEGGWHMWKVGVRWDKEAVRMRKPSIHDDLFLVGSDLCPGSCQFWAEGALKTVESLLKEYFPKAWVAPLEDHDFTEGNIDVVNISKEETSINY